MLRFSALRNRKMLSQAVGLGFAALFAASSFAAIFDPNAGSTRFEQSGSFSGLNADDISSAMAHFGAELSRLNRNANVDTHRLVAIVNAQLPDLKRLEQLRRDKGAQAALEFSYKMDRVARLASEIYQREKIVPDPNSPLYTFYLRWAKTAQEWKDLAGVTRLSAEEAARKLLGDRFDSLDDKNKSELIANLKEYQESIEKNSGKANAQANEILREISADLSHLGIGTSEVASVVGGLEGSLIAHDTDSVLRGDGSLQISESSGRALSNFSPGVFDGALASAIKDEGLFSLGNGSVNLIDEIADYGARIGRGDYDNADSLALGGRDPAGELTGQHDGTSKAGLEEAPGPQRVATQGYSIPMQGRDQGTQGLPASPVAPAHDASSISDLSKASPAKTKPVLDDANPKAAPLDPPNAAKSPLVPETPLASAATSPSADSGSSTKGRAEAAAEAKAAFESKNPTTPPPKPNAFATGDKTELTESSYNEMITKTLQSSVSNYTSLPSMLIDNTVSPCDRTYKDFSTNESKAIFAAGMIVKPVCANILSRSAQGTGCLLETQILKNPDEKDCWSCIREALKIEMSYAVNEFKEGPKSEFNPRLISTLIAGRSPTFGLDNVGIATSNFTRLAQNNLNLKNSNSCIFKSNTLINSLAAEVGVELASIKLQLQRVNENSSTAASSTAHGTGAEAPAALPSTATSRGLAMDSNSTAKVPDLKPNVELRGFHNDLEKPTIDFSKTNENLSCEENFNQHIKKQLNGQSDAQNYSRYFNRLLSSVAAKVESKIVDSGAPKNVSNLKEATEIKISNDLAKNKEDQKLCSLESGSNCAVGQVNEGVAKQAANLYAGRRLLSAVLFANDSMCVGENGKFPETPQAVKGGALPATECPTLNLSKPSSADKIKLAALNWWIDLQPSPAMVNRELSYLESSSEYEYFKQTVSEPAKSLGDPYLQGVVKTLLECPGWPNLIIQNEAKMRKDAAFCGSIEAKFVGAEKHRSADRLRQKMNEPFDQSKKLMGYPNKLPDLEKRIYTAPDSRPQGLPSILLESSEDGEKGLECFDLRERYAFWLGLIVGPAAAAPTAKEPALFKQWKNSLEVVQDENSSSLHQEANAPASDKAP